jgi:hypothetical protein
VTVPDGRIPLSPQPDDEHEWTYLQPVVDAERSWGNEPTTAAFAPVGKGEGWLLLFRRPLHVGRLRDRFVFPDFVEIIDNEPRTAVVDTRFPFQGISIEGDIPLGWVRGASPSGYVRDTSKITRLMLRLSGGGRGRP